MRLHLTRSTLNTADNRPRNWGAAAMLVDFVYRGGSGSIEQLTAEIGNHFNNDAPSLTIVEPKLTKRSGRYKHKSAVPI